jgi:hypothetical protein
MNLLTSFRICSCSSIVAANKRFSILAAKDVPSASSISPTTKSVYSLRYDRLSSAGSKARNSEESYFQVHQRLL